MVVAALPLLIIPSFLDRAFPDWKNEMPGNLPGTQNISFQFPDISEWLANYFNRRRVGVGDRRKKKEKRKKKKEKKK